MGGHGLQLEKGQNKKKMNRKPRHADDRIIGWHPIIEALDAGKELARVFNVRFEKGWFLSVARNFAAWESNFDSRGMCFLLHLGNHFAT